MPTKKITIVLTPVICAIIAVFLYALIHEGGHALAALAQGGKVIRFDVNIITSSPHVVLSGDFSNLGRAVINIAGIGLTFFVWLSIVPFLSRIKPVLIKLVAIIYSITFLGSLLASVVLPLVYFGQGGLESEDIVKFIQNTGIHPLIVSALIFAISIFSLYYLIKIGKIIEIVKNLIKKYNLGIHGSHKKLKIAAIALTNIICIVIVLNIIYREKREIPENFDVRIQTNFDERYLSGSEIYKFTVDETKVFDFVYSINTKNPVILTLKTKNEEGFVFNLKKEIIISTVSNNVRNSKFTGFILEPGEYSVNLKTEDARGAIDMYISSKAATGEMLEFLRIQKEVSNGTFNEKTYREEGYTLLFKGSLQNFEKYVIYEFESSGFTQISFFVVGEYESVDLKYQDDTNSLTILKNFNSTMGFGFEAVSEGKLFLSAVDASGMVYLYGK